MALRIKANSLLTKRFLEVQPKGVLFMETSGFGGARKFSFSQIELILMSPTHTLSFQVGREVFRISTNPNNKTHQQVIQALLKEVREKAPR